MIKTKVVNHGLVELASPLTTGQTQMTLKAGHGAKLTGAVFPIMMMLGDPAVDTTEIIQIDSIDGDVCTIQREQEGSTAPETWPVDTPGRVTLTAKMWNDVRYAALASENIFYFSGLTGGTGAKLDAIQHANLIHGSIAIGYYNEAPAVYMWKVNIVHSNQSESAPNFIYADDNPETYGMWQMMSFDGGLTVAKAIFNANTILKADEDNNPVPTLITENTLIGRLAGGVIQALSAAQIRTLLNVENGAQANPSASAIASSYAAVVPQVSEAEKNAGTEEAIRRMSPKDVADMATIHGGANISDDEYDPATWDNDIANTPSKNAIRDKIVSMDAAINAKLGAESDPVFSASEASNFTTGDKAKLDGIEAGATADQTGNEIKTLYEAEANTNAFTDAEKAKLGTIEENAQANPSASEIKSSYESNANTNAFTDAEKAALAEVNSNAVRQGGSATLNQAIIAIPKPAVTITEGRPITSADFGKTIYVDSPNNETLPFPSVGASDDGAEFTTVPIGAGVVVHNRADADTLYNETAVSITAETRYESYTWKYYHAKTMWTLKTVGAFN